MWASPPTKPRAKNSSSQQNAAPAIPIAATLLSSCRILISPVVSAPAEHHSLENVASCYSLCHAALSGWDGAYLLLPWFKLLFPYFSLSMEREIPFYASNKKTASGGFLV